VNDIRLDIIEMKKEQVTAKDDEFWASNDQLSQVKKMLNLVDQKLQVQAQEIAHLRQTTETTSRLAQETIVMMQRQNQVHNRALQRHHDEMMKQMNHIMGAIVELSMAGKKGREEKVRSPPPEEEVGPSAEPVLRRNSTPIEDMPETAAQDEELAEALRSLSAMGEPRPESPNLPLPEADEDEVKRPLVAPLPPLEVKHPVPPPVIEVEREIKVNAESKYTSEGKSNTTVQPDHFVEEKPSAPSAQDLPEYPEHLGDMVARAMFSAGKCKPKRQPVTLTAQIAVTGMLPPQTMPIVIHQPEAPPTRLPLKERFSGAGTLYGSRIVPAHGDHQINVQTREFAYQVEDTKGKTWYGDVQHIYKFKICEEMEGKVMDEEERPFLLRYSDIKSEVKLSRVMMRRTIINRFAGMAISMEHLDFEFAVSYEFFTQLINPTNLSLLSSSIDAAKRLSEVGKDPKHINYDRTKHAKPMADTIVLAYHYREYIMWMQREMDFPAAQAVGGTPLSTGTDTVTYRSQRSARLRRAQGLCQNFIWILLIGFLWLPHWAYMSTALLPLMVTIMIFPVLWRVSANVLLVSALNPDLNYLRDFENLLEPGFGRTLYHLMKVQMSVLRRGWQIAIMRLPVLIRLNAAVNRCLMATFTNPQDIRGWLSALLKMSLILTINTYVASMLGWMMLKLLWALILNTLSGWSTAISIL